MKTLSVAFWTVGRTLVVIDRTVSAIGSSRPICSVLFPRLCSSADASTICPAMSRESGREACAGRSARSGVRDRLARL